LVSLDEAVIARLRKGEEHFEVLVDPYAAADIIDGKDVNIIQSLDSGLMTIDLSGKINFLNRTAEKILNRNGEELVNASIDDLFPKPGTMIVPQKD
jgi:sensor histidine kinase regulating citrate/malate metabolism